MRFLRELFSENSTISSMRVMCMIALLSAVGIAIAGIMRPTVDYSGLTMLVTAFLGAAMTGKLVQKNIEKSDK